MSVPKENSTKSLQNSGFVGKNFTERLVLFTILGGIVRYPLILEKL